MSTRLLTFDYVYVERVKLGPGEHGVIDLFVNHPVKSEDRMSDQGEQNLVRWVLNDEVRRRQLMSKVCETPGRIREGIQDREFQLSKAPKGGDLDLVVLEDDRPSQGVCVEFKKVKVRLDSNGDERVNGLEKLNKLIAQGNARQSQGFWKTYICAVVVIDKCEPDRANLFARRADSREIQRLYSLDSMAGINSDVGILLIELSQPTGKAFTDLFGMGICKVKEAGILEQPTRLTEDLQMVFRQPSGVWA